MPIEDADRLHSKKGGDTLFIIFGYKLNLMKCMMIAGCSIAGLFLLVSLYFYMSPAPTPVPVNVTIDATPTTTMDFSVTNNNNCRIIKLHYTGTKSFNQFNKEVFLSMNPPTDSPYIQRQAIMTTGITSFNQKLENLYIYTGYDNLFHASYTIPKESECIDFVNGTWAMNADDGITHYNMYTYKFSISNSKTKVINTFESINESLKSDYTTLFIQSGTYKERLFISKSVKLFGIGNPVIDAGGVGAGIVVQSNNNVISGLTVINSGINNNSDGGIILLPGSSGNTITKNTIYKTLYGIWLNQANSNTITNNTIYDNDNTGIRITKANLNTIMHNTIYNNVYGIYADSSSDLNIIKENTLKTNIKYGILIDNYKNLKNICEYNIYTTDQMSCSDSVNRDQHTTTASNGTVIKITSTPTISSTDPWSSCGDNPKCYQS